MPNDPRIDAYIARQPAFSQPILGWCRARVHAVVPQVEETMKWSAPSFLYGGTIFAGMASFKGHATFRFWQRGVVQGEAGEASAAQFGHLMSIEDLPPQDAFDALLRQAVALIDTGAGKRTRVAAAPKPEAEVPHDLAQALAADSVAAATFHAFPPSARRDYCDWVADAKRDETRARRVDEAMAWLREGKRRNWRYENC